ncbi:MAG: tRNA glutamyl-Q(34) synthetase GluQRS [Rhodospirillales bacterium]|nr:tRNA glutamyl-Q(34) synthetase GluQRS [Rhodospirillales bacterium]MCB9964826.1 tRNA glutamyl-Q(34) synthetase GluQRS [Rhodospirillales bacterium]
MTLPSSLAPAPAPVVTRFAPSPTGRLHLGHAYSALFAYHFAKDRGGRFILRIEDIDPSRCKAEYIDGIYEDLSWLGLDWDTPVRLQSQHHADYRAALQKLQDCGVLYSCFCTRKEIQDEISRAGYAPHGPEGALYPGTCRSLRGREAQTESPEQTAPFALRLDLAKALAMIPASHLFWQEWEEGAVPAQPDLLGDIVVARKDIGTSYHLSVVVDDALQGVTHVTRGVDLRYATPIQRVLQELLGLPVPQYVHHPLLTDERGQRFAKRDRSVTLQELRKSGLRPEDIRSKIRNEYSFFRQNNIQD